ncbi:endonuclease domain-containing protein, partial [Chryseobacterium rhizosphaerae]
FDRQRIIGNYIVDFYVKALGLVIEIDGSSHDEKKVYDGIRQEYLESLGLLVFRVDDFDIRNNLSIVMRELEEFIILNYGTTPSSKIL